MCFPIRLSGIAAGVLLTSLAGAGTPVVVESGWGLVAEVEADTPRSPRFHPLDGSILYASDGSGEGLYRFTRQQLAPFRIATYDRPATILIDPDDGDVFIAENYSGAIFHYDWTTHASTNWGLVFDSGDNDPVGMVIVPAGYTGPLATAGEVVSVDSGATNPDGVWQWSLDTMGGETRIMADSEPFEDLRDVAVAANTLFLADGVAGVYRVSAGGAAEPFPISPPVTLVQGIVTDPNSGELIIVDGVNGSVLRVNPITGASSEILTGLTISPNAMSPVSFSADGRELVVADHAGGRIYIYADCGAVLDPIEDCNQNGIRDLCEFDTSEELSDCNRNGIDDTCEIAAGLTPDCNEDGIPDDCASCPPVDIVFVMDTSSSMNDEASVICATVTALSAYIANQGIDLQAEYLGIADTPGGAFGCLTDSVINRFGTTVPGMPPAGNETLGDCPGGSEVPSEDWARATSIVAAYQPWRPGALRIVVPISDEGPWCGDPVNVFDDDATFHAITIALGGEVIISPLLGTGSSQAVIDRGALLADATGGEWTLTTEGGQEIFDSISNIVLAACFRVTDCNQNGIPDDCDIASGHSADVDPADGIPDECQIPADCNGNDIPDAVEIYQGLIPDCNGNRIPDDCEVIYGLATDCNGNGNPDECDIIEDGFPTGLLENTTGAENSRFLGPPDDVYWGLGGQIVTFDLTFPPYLTDGPGADFNVYEVNTGANEFSMVSVLVSADGVNFVSVDSSMGPWVPIAGDVVPGDTAAFTHSYDIAASGLSNVRYIRLDGNGTGGAGASTGFDLDAIGIIHGGLSVDGNGNGVPDECDCRGDANLDGF
ncbi:MAG: hypothetical protein KDA21_09255, partial [Phycisphaerales bacterium]|nr:hypothetical protein [Phycisphaerales bacterium]